MSTPEPDAVSAPPADARTTASDDVPPPPATTPGPGPDDAARAIGVGPWPGPWPVTSTGEPDPRYDPALLEHGDRRNVEDRYRYLTHEAICADLATRRHGFHVAIENLEHDFNIGSIVRTANALGAAAFHIVGKRRWNRRGAMVTDRYQVEHHHRDAAALGAWARAEDLTVIGLDNVPGAVPLEGFALPRDCVLLIGQEGPGLTEEALAECAAVVAITQYGSTRSMNAGAAAAIAMYEWLRQHV